MKKFLYLFLACLIFSHTSAQKLKKLGIEFESMTYNFGEVQMWENQPAIFILTNHSKHAISILPLFSENDLEIIYPEKAIQPGEQAIIKAIYYTSGTGSFSRKFPIYFNASPEAYNLKITGNIKSLSPTAYINCPMAKPEHSKPKVELFGNVAEIESEIPLSGSTIRIVGVSNKIDLTFFADRMGNFGSKLPTGNYEVMVSHPRYESHQSIFYLGQQSGHLKIRLSPIEEEILAQNPPSLSNENIERKEGEIENNLALDPPNRVDPPAQELVTPKPDIEESDIERIETNRIEETKPTNLALEAADPVELPKEPVRQVSTTLEDEENEAPIEESTRIEPVYVEPIQDESDPIITDYSPVIEEATNIKEYTVRVIDELALNPIENAELFITPILNKKKTTKAKSNEMGLASVQLDMQDYKIIINADHYISGEAIIRADQEDEIIRVYLSPVSNLFEEIYANKKEAQSPNEILNQLSFGTTEFTFAADEESKEDEPTSVIETAQIVQEVDLEEIDFEEETAVSTPAKTNENIVVPELSSSEVVETTAPTPPTPELNLDSIQDYLAELQAQKEALELSLAEASLELSEKEKEIEAREVELQSKDEALDEKASELALAKEELKQNELAELSRKEEELITVGEESEVLSVNDYAANNVLFLIDVSSSMAKQNKMELLKESLKSLTAVLRDIDRVAIIAYNQKTNVVLESISGDNKSAILAAIDSLETSGLTYGVRGLQNAYDLLQYYYIGDGNNQIILATDGLFSSVNAAMSENELNKEVRKQASGNNIKLSVIGFGQDEEGEKLMQKLANNGEGQFIQINNPWEARTVLVDEIKLNSKK